MSGFDFYEFTGFHHDADSPSAEARANTAVEEVYYLRHRLDKICLVSQALWELLREKTSLTDDDLLHKMQEVDLRDGKLDARMAAELQKCPECGRAISARHGKCLYCGTPGAGSDKSELFNV